MKNPQAEEWRFSRRWLRLQEKAKNSTRTEKLAKILGEMSDLLTEMEGRTAAPKTPRFSVMESRPL